MDNQVKSTPRNGVPNWLAYTGHLLALVLIVFLVWGLLLDVVPEALRNGTIGVTYHNHRFEFNQMQSPIGFWSLIALYIGFPSIGAWFFITDNIPKIFKRLGQKTRGIL